jgi:hypothetical protein
MGQNIRRFPSAGKNAAKATGARPACGTCAAGDRAAAKRLVDRARIPEYLMAMQKEKPIRRVLLLGATALLLAGCFPGMQQQQVVKTDASFSPDGSRIVFVSTQDGDAEIYLMDADGANLRKLTDNSAVDASPGWSPDGRRILFVSNRNGQFELYVMGADGSNPRMLASGE